MKKVNLKYEIFTIIFPILVLYGFCLLMLWNTHQEYFWRWLFIGFGVITITIFIIVLFKIINKKRKDNLIKNINTLGLKNDIDSFVNRAGNEKDKYAWKYMGYNFNIDKMKVFVKVLKENGLKIKNKSDLEHVLKYFIDNKEENIIRGGFTFKENKFSSLGGTEFENLLVKLFQSMKYIVEHPGSVGDQGGDLILNKDGERILIQAKCYTNNIGNKAVQEAVAAQKYYVCNKVMVVGTSDFTQQAIDLAKMNDVELVGKKQLQEMILLYLNESWI